MEQKEPGRDKRIRVSGAFRSDVDRRIEKRIEETGGENVLQAIYLRRAAKAVAETQTPAISYMKPELKLEGSPAWQKALCLCVAYLRRYKMGETLTAMKEEGADVPKATGFTRASEVTECFNSLSSASDSLAKQDFSERLHDFCSPGSSSINEGSRSSRGKRRSGK